MSGFNHSEANVALDSNRGRARNKDFSHNRDASKGISKSKFKGKFICHYCNNPRHIEKFCKKMKRDKSQERKKRWKLQLPGNNNNQMEKLLQHLELVVMMYVS